MIKHFRHGLFLVSIFSLITQLGSSQNIESNYVLVINTFNSKGAPDKSIDFYKTHLNEKPEDLKLKIALANAYYGMHDFKQAANLYFEINAKNNDLANYELARCYAYLGKPDLAVKHLKQHLQSKDKFMQRQIKSDQAFASIEKSKEWVALWKTDWYTKYDLMFEDAWYAYEHDHFEEALGIVDNLNNIRKSLVQAYNLKALIYLKLNEPENALVAINAAIEKRDKYSAFYETKAMVELELKKPKKALKTIATAINMDSTQISYFFIRARAFLETGQVDKANTDLEWMMYLVPDFDVYKLAGEIYNKAGEYQSALKAFNKCIAMQKYNSELYILRGKVYQTTSAYGLAENDYTMALDFQPYNGELYYLRGITRKMQHKADLACQDFKKAFTHKYMKADDEIRSYCQGR